MSMHSLFPIQGSCLKYLSAALAMLLSVHQIIPLAIAAGPEAHLKGEFGALHTWPIMPVHMSLMPDGRVFAFGPKNWNSLKYSIWDPSIGTSPNAFETLPNITDTNIFCAGQATISETGQSLLLGGDTLANPLGIPNYGPHTASANIFDPATDSLTPVQGMAFKRWYPTAVMLPNGEHVVMGGRSERPYTGTPTILAEYAPTPEVRAVNGSWRTLSSATSDFAYGKYGGSSWFYPRAWLNPQGTIFIHAHNGSMFKLDPSGTGTLTKYTNRTTAGRNPLPSVMFAPGRILSIRDNRVATIVDINGVGEPTVSSGGNLAKDRQFGNATVLADGRVWVNGGSSTGNNLAGAALDSELWDPNTGTWTTAASASTVRLYHSAALLLADGTVLTGGGGMPGPIKQLNGEIYYPPYLFKTDGSGEFAPRPEIIDAPTAMIGWNQEFSIESTDTIVRVTLVRTGAVTHAFNNEQRFFDLPILETGNIVTARSPASATVAPPGFYLLFVWNAAGIPSIARFVHMG